MASSSEWLEQAVNVPKANPDWLDQVSARGGFVAGTPFALKSELVDPIAKEPAEPSAEPLAHTVPIEEDPIALAFAEGEARGRAEAMAEMQTTLEAQRALRLAFREFDATTLDTLASELTDTVIALCEQVLGERALKPDGLRDRCLAAAQRLGAVPGHCTLLLHPDDLSLLDEECLGDWDVKPGPLLPRGSLVIEGPEGAVRDGPAEWRRAIKAALRG